MVSSSGALLLLGLLANSAGAIRSSVDMEEDMVLQSSSSLQDADGECADAWGEFVGRLEHFNSQMQKRAKEDAERDYSAIVQSYGEQDAKERFPNGIPPKSMGVATVEQDFKDFVQGLLNEGKLNQVAMEWKAFERTSDISGSVAAFLVQLIAREWGNRETWESAATFWDMYNDFSPGVAPYVVEVLKDLPNPKERYDWDQFKLENKKLLSKAVTKMFQDLRDYCKEAPIVEAEPEPVVVEEAEPEPIVTETVKIEEKPVQPGWDVKGPDGSMCPSGCDNCLEAKEKAKRGKVWCYTKKMPSVHPNIRCNAMLYSGKFQVDGNRYGYRYLCRP